MFPGTAALKFSDSQCSALSILKTAEKRKLSEQKRQASLHAKTQTASSQQKVIAAALADECQGRTNKKIRFSSESSDESEPGIGSGIPPSGSKNPSIGKSNKAAKKTLFEDSDDNEQDTLADISQSFRAAVQYRGTAGEKLRNLESKFGGDQRFKMTANFLDDDGSEKEMDEKLNGDLAYDERNQQLKILENIVGKPINSALRRVEKEKKKKLFQTGASVRYDPTKAEHYRYKKETTVAQNVDEDASSSNDEKQEKAESGDDGSSINEATSLQEPKRKKSKKTKSVNNEKADESGSSEGAEEIEKQDPSATKSYYQMDTDFAKSLASKQEEKETGTSFSLLASLGRDIKPEINKETDTQRSDNNSVNLKPWQKQILNEKDSRTLNGVSESDKHKSFEDKIASNAQKSTFFFASDHPEIIRAVKKFCRTEDMTAVRKKWEIYRDSLVKSYKRQKKEALQRKNQKQKQWQRNKQRSMAK